MRLDLLLRADATPEVGAGHAVRLLNLADAWIREDLGTVTHVGTLSLDFVRRRLTALGVQSPPEPPAGGPFVLVADTYDEEERRLQAQRAGCALRVLVDDLGGPVPRGYGAVWNPNAYGSAALYPECGVPVLSGPALVPLRRGLPRWRGSDPGAVGVLLGGGTPTAEVRRAFDLAARAIGERRVRGVGDWVPASWERLSADEPWSGLSGCSCVVTAAGSSVWEAAAVGVPVVVVKTARNQDRVFEWAALSGAPTVDGTSDAGPESLARALVEAIPRAAVLPRITPGAGRVARALHRLALTAGVA